jgi:predicted DNA-binding protein
MRQTPVGRPRKHEEIVWFGMKLSPEAKSKIKMLASHRGIPASELVLELVEKELQAERRSKKLSAAAIRKLGKDARSTVLREAARRAVSQDSDYEFTEDILDLIDY